MIGVGSRYESAQVNGISHFLEHMAFKGTSRRPTALDIASAVDNIGGETNAFTSKEYTGFYVKVAAKDVDISIDLLQDILFHSTLGQTEIDRERRVIVEEINMYRDSPRDTVSDMFERLLYPDQPLGREVTGTPESLQQINHDQLASFNHQWYTPNNMVVAVAGQFDQPAMIDRLAQTFGTEAQHAVAKYQKATFSQDKPRLVVQQKDTDQTQLIIGWRSYSATAPQRYAVALLNVMLGGNMSSRLFTQVREKRGLAYSVHTSVDDYMDTGSLVCQAGLGHQTLDQAITVILDQFADLRQNGPAPQELDRAKANLRGRLALSLEDNLSMSVFHARQWLLEQQIHTYDEIMKGISAVDEDQIKQVADEIFVANKLNAAVIGPKVDYDHLLPLLKA
jgi:predicted Zn-dependent peptidase